MKCQMQALTDAGIITVAPPRGERGLKYICLLTHPKYVRVAPPRGERGLKCIGRLWLSAECPSRSPSWGAWIEILFLYPQQLSEAQRRSPSWGAWIEMSASAYCVISLPRRSPSWGAWIEIAARPSGLAGCTCRSPSWGAWIEINNHVANVCVSALLTFMRGAEKWRILYNYGVHSST